MRIVLSLVDKKGFVLVKAAEVESVFVLFCRIDRGRVARGSVIRHRTLC